MNPFVELASLAPVAPKVVAPTGEIPPIGSPNPFAELRALSPPSDPFAELAALSPVKSENKAIDVSKPEQRLKDRFTGWLKQFGKSAVRIGAGVGLGTAIGSLITPELRWHITPMLFIPMQAITGKWSSRFAAMKLNEIDAKLSQLPQNNKEKLERKKELWGKILNTSSAVENVIGDAGIRAFVFGFWAGPALVENIGNMIHPQPVLAGSETTIESNPPQSHFHDNADFLRQHGGRGPAMQPTAENPQVNLNPHLPHQTPAPELGPMPSPIENAVYHLPSEVTVVQGSNLTTASLEATQGLISSPDIGLSVGSGAHLIVGDAFKDVFQAHGSTVINPAIQAEAGQRILVTVGKINDLLAGATRLGMDSNTFLHRMYLAGQLKVDLTIEMLPKLTDIGNTLKGA